MRFAQDNNFFEGDFFRKEILKWKENKKEMIKTSFFLKKLERRNFSKHETIIRKWDVEHFFLLEKQFLWRIFYEVQKISICHWKTNFKKKKKIDDRLIYIK